MYTRANIKVDMQYIYRCCLKYFLNEFFKAFGHESAVRAGATFELPIPKASVKGHIGYADLWWSRDSLATLLIKMKSRGGNLNRHYGQVWDYCKQLNPRLT